MTRPASEAASPALCNSGPQVVTSDLDVRETLRRLPAAMQLPLTFLAGKPYRGQIPIRLTPTAHLAAAICSMAIGLTLSCAALHNWATIPWLPLLVPGWAITLHGLRNLRMMIYHQCAHRNMWARTGPDRIFGRIIAALLMVQDFECYSREHIGEHHALHHMTLRDPTVQAMLVGLELRAGMTRAEMWHMILVKIMSPRFHASFLVARFRSYMHSASPAARTTTACCYLGIAAAATMLNIWPYLIVAWMLPLTLFFQISNVLRLCVKHTFPPPGTANARSKEYFASLTNAIFLGEPAPPSQVIGLRRVAAWMRWASQMAFVHFPARYLVLTGDTVCHDFHHRHPMSRNWANYIFARQADIDAGHPGWPPYREVWGLIPAINLVLDSLVAADPEKYNPSRLPKVSKRQIFAAFDD